MQNNDPITNPVTKKSQWYKKWWGIILIIFVFIPLFFIVFLATFSIETANKNVNNQSEQKTTETVSNPLKLSASYDNSIMYIISNEEVALAGCSFTLNNDYKYMSGKTYRIEAGQTIQLYMSDFANSNNIRFNVYAIKPNYLSTWCHRPDGNVEVSDIWWN